MSKENLKSRKIRLADVARKTGVSISAVSMALAERPNISKETIRRIQSVTQEMGYKRRTAVKSKSNTTKKLRQFGFLLVGRRLHDSAYSGILDELMILTQKSGDRLQTMSIEEHQNPDKVIDSLATFTKDMDGLFLTGYITNNILDYLKKIHLQFVVLGETIIDENHSPIFDTHKVMLDETSAGRYAVNKLVACGHKKIAFIAEVLTKGLSISRWLDGYKLGLMDASIEIDPNFIQIAGHTYAGGEPAARIFSGMDDFPTAYFIPDARMASSFILAMKKTNRTLNHNSLITCNDPSRCMVYGLPDCPTIYGDLHELTKAGFYLLDQLINRCMPDRISLLIAPQTQNFDKLISVNESEAL